MFWHVSTFSQVSYKKTLTATLSLDSPSSPSPPEMDFSCSGSPGKHVEKPENSCLGLRASHSDEDVILAANRPKKRSGRRVFKETRHPVYRGVRRRNSDKWVSEVREPKKKTRIWLGTYPTAEMAARAHDIAVLALRGKTACLNFADSAWRFTVPDSADSKEIRMAASRAAEAAGREGNAEKEEERRETKKKEEDVFYMNEEEENMFGIPRMFGDVADLPFLSPQHLGHGDDVKWDDLDIDADVSLWSFSV